ncbi:DUF547 domain-containing protein [Marinoscillum sp.]|uniref:DUF547 domain-containing protein n=1 Tax=Marinoscillum sp. TaxID=2024838 RepID=UPI003BABBD4E
MKSLLCLALVLIPAFSFCQENSFFNKTHTFLKTHVEAGLIDYESIKKNPDELVELVTQIANYQIVGKDPTVQKAFYTNAYNILVIYQVVENFPIDSPWDVEGFFDTQEFEIAGRMATLDELEKEILFAAFPDPRLHFVLVCAAIGCPPIANYVYSPDSLESTLEAKTKDVLNIDWYVRVSKNKTAVSKVFDWYQSDFISDSTDVKDYINKFRSIRIPEAHPIETYDYNWELNDAKGRFRY